MTYTTAYRDAFDLGAQAQLIRCLSIIDSQIAYWHAMSLHYAEERDYQRESNALMRRDLLVEVVKKLHGTPFGPQVIVPDYLK